MANMSADRLLMCSFEPVRRGETFDHQLPLHVTVQPPFVMDSDAAFMNGLNNLAYATRPITIAPGERALYGPDYDVPVCLIGKGRAQLQRLHAKTGELIGRFGGIAEHPFSGDNYSPHVADVGTPSGETLVFSDERLLRAIQYVALANPQTKTPHRILASYVLGGNE